MIFLPVYSLPGFFYINDPESISMFKFNNSTIRKRCEKCSKLTTKTPNAIDVVLVPLLLTLNIFTHFSAVSIAEFEQVNVY